LTISKTAERVYSIKLKIFDLKSCEEAQNSPCAFGTTCIVYNGKVVAETPISNKRFINIINEELKG